MYRLFIDHIEILPKAGHDGKILKSISFRFPGQFGESSQADRKEVAGKELCFTLDCTNLKLSAERTKATYAELKRYILDNHGLKVSSLYIAQIKRKYGLEVGEQYHKPADPDIKVPICPPAKEDAIKEALIHFKML